jgi:hypothetical protein
MVRRAVLADEDRVVREAESSGARINAREPKADRAYWRAFGLREAGGPHGNGHGILRYDLRYVRE